MLKLGSLRFGVLLFSVELTNYEKKREKDQISL